MCSPVPCELRLACDAPAGQLALIDAEELHQSSLVIDGSCVFPTIDAEALRRLRAGAINCVCWTAATPDLGGDDFAATVKKIRAVHALASDRDAPLTVVTGSQELDRLRESERIGVIFALQDAWPIRDDLDLRWVLRDIGLRVMQPVYTNSNLCGSGCGEPADGGLTYFGRDLIHKVNEARVVVDVSHAGPRTTADILQCSQQPVVATHSNARALCPSLRNKDDDIARAIAETGGVVGVPLPAGLVSKELPTDLAHFVDHIAHFASTIGVDHVGLGLDSLEIAIENPTRRLPLSRRCYSRRPDIFGPEGDGGTYWPQPACIESVQQAANITAALLARGFAAEDVQKILGGNWYRVFKSVWKQPSE